MEAILVGIHLENPKEPFYTLRIDEREIQTEPHRYTSTLRFPFCFCLFLNRCLYRYSFLICLTSFSPLFLSRSYYIDNRVLLLEPVGDDTLADSIVSAVAIDRVVSDDSAASDRRDGGCTAVDVALRWTSTQLSALLASGELGQSESVLMETVAALSAGLDQTSVSHPLSSMVIIQLRETVTALLSASPLQETARFESGSYLCGS